MKELSIPQLFGQLKYDQVFPRAYLALVSLFSGYFSFSLQSVRFLPLIFMISGFLIWLYLYKKQCRPEAAFLLTAFTFASSVFTTYYAGMIKQYSCDLCAIAIFTLFIYFQDKYYQKKLSLKYIYSFCILTPLLILFSHMSFLILWVPLYNFLLSGKEKKELKLPFLIYFILIICAALLVYWSDIRYSMQVKFMQEYWNNAFIDTGSLYAFSKTFTNGLRNIIVRWFVEEKIAKSIASVFMPFAVAAIFINARKSLAKNHYKILDINALCAILLLELLALGMLRIYPFTGARITLFIAPFIFYMIVEGIYLVKKVKFIFYPLATAYLIFLSGVSYYLLNFYLHNL